MGERNGFLVKRKFWMQTLDQKSDWCVCFWSSCLCRRGLNYSLSAFISTLPRLRLRGWASVSACVRRVCVGQSLPGVHQPHTSTLRILVQISTVYSGNFSRWHRVFAVLFLLLSLFSCSLRTQKRDGHWTSNCLIRLLPMFLLFALVNVPFYPTADEDVSVKCLSSLWLWLRGKQNTH